MGGDRPLQPLRDDWFRHFNASHWFLEPCEESASLFGLELEHQEALHEERSDYQLIQVFDTRGFGRILVLDRFLMLAARDNFIYHEMLVHPVLFTHPQPRRVLIIGGGDCGCLREVLRHDGLELCVQVELDERVTRVCEQYFPELCEANDDPRASLLFADGIEHVGQADAGSFDVIIVDSTDPIGQAARLFSREFYAQCRRVLGNEGLLVAQSESPLIHTDIVCAIRDAMEAGGFSRVSTLQFPQSTYPSGWWSATLAGGDRLHDEFRAGDAVRRRFTTRYYNPAVHRGALALPQFLLERLGT